MFWNKIKVFNVSNSVELNLICSLRPFLHSTIRGIPRSPKQALPSPPHGWRGRGSGGPAPAQSRRTRSRRPPAWVPEPEPSPSRAEDPTNQGTLLAPLQGGCHSCSVRLRWPQRASSEVPSGSSGGSSGHPSWVGGGGSVHELSPQPVLDAPSAPALLTTSVTHPPSPPHPGASTCTVGPQCSLVVLK